MVFGLLTPLLDLLLVPLVAWFDVGGRFCFDCHVVRNLSECLAVLIDILFKRVQHQLLPCDLQDEVGYQGAHLDLVVKRNKLFEVFKGNLDAFLIHFLALGDLRAQHTLSDGGRCPKHHRIFLIAFICLHH